jgi:hypothetical protein
MPRFPQISEASYCADNCDHAIKVGDSVTVPRSNGVAWRFWGHPVKREYSEPYWESVVEECDCFDKAECNRKNHGYWVEDPEGYESVEADKAVVVMVGDDQRLTYDMEDLTPLPDEAFCGECGQIGCTHDGKERD